MSEEQVIAGVKSLTADQITEFNRTSTTCCVAVYDPGKVPTKNWAGSITELAGAADSANYDSCKTISLGVDTGSSSVRFTTRPPYKPCK